MLRVFLLIYSTSSPNFADACTTRKQKETVDGIRSHMIDKGYCKIVFDEELDHFYDIEGESDNGAEEEMAGEDERYVETEYISPPQEHDFYLDHVHEVHLLSDRILGYCS